MTGITSSSQSSLASEHLCRSQPNIPLNFYLMHGREAKLPLEIENSNVVSDVAQLGDIQDTIDRLTTLRTKIFALRCQQEHRLCSEKAERAVPTTQGVGASCADQRG